MAGDAAGARLAGPADGALRAARRRQRLARAGFGLVAAAVVGTAWVALADRAPSRARGSGRHRGRQRQGGPRLPPAGHLVRGAPLGPGQRRLHRARIRERPAFCVHADRAGGMTDVRVASAKAEKSTADGTWQVEVTLSPADRTRFAALTSSLAEAPAPRNGFAVIIDGKLWGNPFVSSSITGGRLDIVGAHVGDLTGATAHDLARLLDPGR